VSSSERIRQSADGRDYPPHLRAVEKYDEEFIQALAELGSATFDQLSLRARDRKARAALVRWLSSAQWRGIVQRQDEPAGPHTYRLTPSGVQRSRKAA
jgi:hypothetical protein